MIPVMNRNTTYRINIPELSGGLNLRDGLTLIKDNQLTDELNMWNKGGLLRTRPAVHGDYNADIFEYFNGEKYEVEYRVDNNAAVIIEGKKYVLEYEIYKKIVPNYDEENSTVQMAKFRLRHSFENVIELGTIASLSSYYVNMNCLPIIDNGDIYVYVFGEHDPNGDYNDYSIWKIERVGRTYKEPKEINDEAYIPTVFTNCVASYCETLSVNTPPRNAVQVEGFNLISDKYKMVFSMYDYTELAQYPASAEVQSDATFMEYALPFTTKELCGKKYKITLEYTNKELKKYVHSVALPYDVGSEYASVETEACEDGFYLHAFFDKQNVCRIILNNSSDSGNLNPDTIVKSQHINNNMTVTAPIINTSKDKEKIFKMTRATWYGNTSLGLSGGNRVFLGGNTNENDKSLVVWSDLKNPLYFDENNYIYVGDKSQAVTAFGKQGSSLVIFKEHETYSTQYTQNSITAEEVINQQIIDTAASSAMFPLTLINPNIGCSCPNTVQLCRNRLVWADNGKVYTLTAQNQYSERNIYEIGEMIKNDLVKLDMSNAQSADWEDHYLLFVGKNVYVMDYSSYGYTNVASYTKTEDANLLIPWHKWELPYDKNLPLDVVRVTNGKELVLTRQKDVDSGSWSDYIKLCDGKADNYLVSVPDVLEERPIKCFIQTKLFDFGYPERYKTIKKVCMSFGDNGGEPITVQCITDTADNDETIITLLTDENGPDSPKYIKNKQIVPYTKFSSRFGLKIACEGQLLIESMTMEYKNAGGIR